MAPPNDGQSRCSKIYRATAVFILLKIDKIPGFRGLLILGHDANLCPPTRRKTRMGLQAGPIQAFVHFILYCSLCYWRQMETAPRLLPNATAKDRLGILLEGTGHNNAIRLGLARTRTSFVSCHVKHGALPVLQVSLSRTPPFSTSYSQRC